jgi:hypothetical protein
MKTQSNSNAGSGCPATTCSPLDVRAIYALDDSCQQLLYVRGHVDKREMKDAAREYAKHAYIGDGAYVLHQYMRTTPLHGNIVCDSKTTFQNEPGRGATPVTVLWLWLPMSSENGAAQPPEEGRK